MAKNLARDVTTPARCASMTTAGKDPKVNYEPKSSD